MLYLNLEDLFLQYDETVDLIKEFLDIDFSHKKKGSKFKPEGMRNYVGVWKNMLNQESIFQIEEELSEYCSIS